MSEVFQKIYDCLNGDFPEERKRTKSFYRGCDMKISIKSKVFVQFGMILNWVFSKRAVYRITRFENCICGSTSSY